MISRNFILAIVCIVATPVFAETEHGKNLPSTTTASGADTLSADEPRADSEVTGTEKPAKDSDASAEELLPIPNIVVSARPLDSVEPFHDKESISFLNRADIERFESQDLFSTVVDIPGVSVNGGPMQSGKTFNIRGFSDSEDVSVELDGVPRDFEKYRFGSGVFIDPQLLRQVEVWRQPSVRSTPGSIGGAVRSWSRNPSEFVSDERRYSGTVKVGYGTNANDRRLMGTFAAQPTDWFGVLAVGSLQQADDIELASGEDLENTAIDNTSSLLKLHFRPTERFSAAIAYQSWKNSSLEPFDATAGQPSFFGFVRRDVDDQTFTLTGLYEIADNWTVNLSLGRAITKVHDLHQEGESWLATPTNGDVNDDYDFTSDSFRIESLYAKSFYSSDIQFTFGVDGLISERDVTRATSNQEWNDIRYPNGWNDGQPSGEKSFLGAYGLAEYSWKALSVYGGLRRTNYHAEALGGTADAMQELNEESSIRFAHTTEEFGAQLRLPYYISVFYGVTSSFRPPLIDEYFTAGSFSRCLPYYLDNQGPESGICGDLYEPEEGLNKEWGVYWQPDLGDMGNAAIKITQFRSKTENILESIGIIDDTITQPGEEIRTGIEIEGNLTLNKFFSRIGYTKIRGEARGPNGYETYFFAPGAIYDIPGDKFSWLIGGFNLLPFIPEMGYRVSFTAARDVLTGSLGNEEVGRQSGYALQDAYINFFVNDNLTLRLVGENLTNEDYNLNSGFGGTIGTPAPGRNVLLFAEFGF